MAGGSLHEDPPTGTLSRHPDLWFEDGNIVLQAEATVFKVFKSVLSKQALLFKDMFSIPQPMLDQEQYDGCALVRVQEEAAALTAFLRAIFEPLFLLSESCDGHDYVVVLRLATKYQAYPLRRQILTFLYHDYPTTLSGYDHIMEDGCDCSIPRAIRGSGWALDAAVADAARDADAILLLPAALLSVSSTEIATIVDAGNTGALDPVNRDTLLKAIPNMSSLARALAFEPLFSSQMHISANCRCQNSGACFRVRHTLRTQIEVAPSLMNPVVTLSFHAGSTVSKLCDPCRKVIQDRYEKYRQEAWDKIPEALNLPSWDDMRKREDELYGVGRTS